MRLLGPRQGRNGISNGTPRAASVSCAARIAVALAVDVANADVARTDVTLASDAPTSAPARAGMIAKQQIAAAPTPAEPIARRIRLIGRMRRSFARYSSARRQVENDAAAQRWAAENRRAI
jgi:hypothetical protein